MMRTPYKSPFRSSSKTNSVTILVFGLVILMLGLCGAGYWRYVEAQTLHLQERNFRALTVTGQALANLVANYETVFKSVIEGKPPDPPNTTTDRRSKSRDPRQTAYKEALQALPSLQDVTIAKATDGDLNGFTVRFVRARGALSIKLMYVHTDCTETATIWKIDAVINIGRVMQQLVTEDIFSDVLLADDKGRVMYHHQSTRDPSGFEFKDASALLHRFNDSGSKEGGAEKEAKDGAERKQNLVSKLPLFNEMPIGGISHAIFAQATDLPADRGKAQTLILMGIVPAGQFHAETRAIPLNYLLFMAGLLLLLFFVMPYIKLRTNAPTERLTPISVAVLIISTVFGTALLTFGLADIATYHHLKQHLNARLKVVSEEIRKQFNDDVRRALNQLALFDHSCQSDECSKVRKQHLAQRLCIRMNESEFFFLQTESDKCLENNDKNISTRVVYSDVKTMFWVGSTGELKIFRSREPDPWKYANLKGRQYVSRIWEDETFTRDQQRFWIQPIYSLTTGDNSAVLSMKSRASLKGLNSGRPIVAALEVKLPSVMGVGVPPGMGFAVIDQEGNVLFHSDTRRNLRENLFEETDRDGRLRQAVFARATTQFDGRYWGKDRHFHITPLFLEKEHIEPPDVYWSLVTYWDTDILQALNLGALYSSGALFLVYVPVALSLGIMGWWMYSRAYETAYRWGWSQAEHLHRYQIALGLVVVSLLAVGIWYLRPHPYPDMLLWGLMPALAAAGVVLSIAQTKADSTGHNKKHVSARPSYRLSYTLVVTLILLAFVVLPALVIFRVSMDVEWRLLAKFAVFDLNRDREIQAQEVQKFYPSTSFHDTSHKSKIRTEFFKKFADRNRVYADFPFESCPQASKESENCSSASRNMIHSGDERLIRLLYQFIDRPRVGQSGAKTDMFLEAPEQWHESEGGTLWFIDRSKQTVSPISPHSIPLPIPQWIYYLLVFGSVAPLVALLAKKTYVFAAAFVVLGVFIWFWSVEQSYGALSNLPDLAMLVIKWHSEYGFVGEAMTVLVVLGVSALLYGVYYVLPRFAVRRVLLVDFPHPSIGPSATNESQSIVGMTKDSKPPDGCSPDSWEVFVKEMSALRDILCLADEPTFCKKVLKQDIRDDFDIVKERIIQKILEAAREYYVQIWEKRTESQRRSLFNLARDGFLHARNPDIGPLLESGLIVADLNLRPMNESFRRFIIRMGLIERLDDVARERTGTWFQVWRPIWVGLLLVMVFLVLTQEQYRAITLAFLGVLPALLGAFSQALTSSRKEKPDAASSA